MHLHLGSAPGAHEVPGVRTALRYGKGRRGPSLLLTSPGGSFYRCYRSLWWRVCPSYTPHVRLVRVGSSGTCYGVFVGFRGRSEEQTKTLGN